MSEFSFMGEPVEKLITENPFFDTEAFYNTFIDEQDYGIFVKGCLQVNVDPDIVTKQAAEIVKLQHALDIALNYKLSLNAPSYIEYCELLKRYEECKEKLRQIKEII